MVDETSIVLRVSDLLEKIWESQLEIEEHILTANAYPSEFNEFSSKLNKTVLRKRIKFMWDEIRRLEDMYDAITNLLEQELKKRECNDCENSKDTPEHPSEATTKATETSEA